jgi:hypothetical protein
MLPQTSFYEEMIIMANNYKKFRTNCDEKVIHYSYMPLELASEGVGIGVSK